MKKSQQALWRISFAAILLTFGLALIFKQATPALAQNISDQTPAKTEYYKAKVDEILKNRRDEDPNNPVYSQNIQTARVIFLNGPEKGVGKDIDYYPKSDAEAQKLRAGETVYVMKVSDSENTYYSISEPYRLPALIWVAAVFTILVLITARWKGLGALAGLAFSLAVIAKYMIPAILKGDSPLIVCLIGSIIIALVSIYIAHGFRLRTSIAVLSTILTIGLAVLIDYGIIHWAKLFGAGTEEAVYAQFGQFGIIDLRGLLLGGIIVGVLGVLDDITTAQAAVVDELRRANPLLGFKELYLRASSVGREHISSLINTLVLAYVGASFPLVLLFQHYEQPLAYILNSELVAEEIARTLIGSSALIIAVPLTTALAAFIFSKRPPSEAADKETYHIHSH